MTITTQESQEIGERFINKIITDHSFNVFSAMQFAMEVHKDQKRKYTMNPYFIHLAEVVGLLAPVRHNAISIAVAWLHDCVEDCNVEIDLLKEKFGKNVAEGVFLLSDLEKGNRKLRKELSRKRLADAPDWVQDIKVCDMISNTSSIVQHDPKFAKIYLEEKKLMIEVLTKADIRLVGIASSMIGAN